MCWFSLKWREALSVSGYSALPAGTFKASGSTDPLKVWQTKNVILAPPLIVSRSPPGYSLAWLHPCIARFRFARQDNCSSTASCGLNLPIRRDSLPTRFVIGKLF